MKTSAEWLNALIAQRQIKSAYAAAKLIGITPTRVYQYRDGVRPFNNFTATRVAQLLDVAPMVVIASAEAEREKNGKHRAYWEKLATAALVALGVGIAQPGPAQAGFNINQIGDPQNTHMRTKRRKPGASRPSRAALALSALARYAGIAPPRNAF